jgi:hypothetical protein
MTQHNGLDEEGREQVERIKAALLKLKPNARHRRRLMFTELYPRIVEMRSMQVSQRAILEVLESEGLKLNPARYKELLEEHMRDAQADSDLHPPHAADCTSEHNIASSKRPFPPYPHSTALPNTADSFIGTASKEDR